jgi:putative CocE/NonD family hydrolase
VKYIITLTKPRLGLSYMRCSAARRASTGRRSSSRGRVYKYDIDLWFTSRVISAGHRLRVVVASGAFPKYDRNLNTGGDNERDTRYIVVRQRILHDRAHPSFVRLPIIPR